MQNRASEVVRSLVDRLTATTGRAFHVFEREPRVTEEFLLRLLGNLPGMAYRCRNDRAWTMEYVSPGCRALTGFDAQDLMGSEVVSYGTLIHPDDRERVWDTVQAAVLDGTTFRMTYRMRRADGSERLVWEQGCAVLADDGTVEAIEGFITDVTDKAELADRLTDHEAQFRALVEQALAGVYMVRDGRMAYVNQRYADIVGRTVEEVVAMESFLDLVHPDDREMAADKVRRRMSGDVFEARYDVRILRPDGEVREVEAHGRRIELGGVPAVMGILVDVTERKREARRYHEAQKLEALGRLATGVAHDVNNFLSLIKVTAQIVQAERAEDTGLVADLAEIVGAVERGAALSRQLMHFGRPQSAVHATASLAPLIEGLAPMLERMAGPRVRLDVRVERDLPDVPLAPTHAEEIVVNLVINACDAMPAGGTLVVTAETAPAEPDREDARSRGHVVLAVTDTGVGIEPEARRRLFEPYYTTKGDRGTGLGLANVWRIALEAGGFVDVESEVGRGATFRIFLPIAPHGEEPS